MSIEVDDELYGSDHIDYSFNSLYITLECKPYITDEDKEFFYELGINKIGFYDHWLDDYIIADKGYAINNNFIYGHECHRLDSVLLRSLNIRFMKMNKREGNFMCKDPWKELL